MAKRKTAKAAKKKTAKKAVKKAPKKKASKTAKKKAKPKTSVKVSITRKVLGKAPQHYEFYLNDGRKLESVYELIDELETMAEDQFRHHVSDIDNHFANWIEHVFDEKHLAEELRLVKDRIETQRTLLKHLVRELTKEAHAKR